MLFIEFVLFWLISIIIWVSFTLLVLRAVSKRVNMSNKRTISLDFSPEAYDVLVLTSKASKNSFTSIFNKSLKLFDIAFEAKSKGYKLAVIDDKGCLIKEISGI